MAFASEDLVHEHEGILFGLSILEKMADRIHRAQSVPAADIGEMVFFFRLFADKCHHGKEEGLLFPAMEKAGIPREGGPIGQMLLEHASGRKFIAKMAAAIEDGSLRTDEFVRAADGYIDLLRAHIAKENSVLFPMGDRMIPADEQTRLAGQFKRFEEEVMGPGVHEKLHQMLDVFSQKYLG